MHNKRANFFVFIFSHYSYASTNYFDLVNDKYIQLNN